jgi:hypothetical protein
MEKKIHNEMAIALGNSLTNLVNILIGFKIRIDAKRQPNLRLIK